MSAIFSKWRVNISHLFEMEISYLRRLFSNRWRVDRIQRLYCLLFSLELLIENIVVAGFIASMLIYQHMFLPFFRRLSLRPSLEELEQKNILHSKYETWLYMLFQILRLVACEKSPHEEVFLIQAYKSGQQKEPVGWPFTECTSYTVDFVMLIYLTSDAVTSAKDLKIGTPVIFSVNTLKCKLTDLTNALNPQTMTIE